VNAITEITNILTDNDLSEAVRATAMLADVSISLWGAERSDAKIMDKVKADAGAVGNVGRAIKNMLAGVDGSLRDTRAAFNAVRSEHYSLTLPWVSDPHAERQRGPRLLPNVLFDRYLGEMSKRKRDAMAALDKFVTEYPDLVVQAKSNLGSLADLDYPSQNEVRGSFKVSFDFEPIPAGTAFRGLSPHMLDRLSKGLAAKQDRMVQGAMSSMWENVRERVTHVVERLSDPANTFKSSTVENVRELLVLLPGWNVAGDPRVAEIVKDLDQMLTGVDVKAIRKTESVRKDVADQAQRVTDKLTQWGL
jgi:hypothetical protein